MEKKRCASITATDHKEIFKIYLIVQAQARQFVSRGEKVKVL